MVHPQWPAHWLGLPVSQTEWETGQWLQPFHIPCQHLRPLQALAEQNTDWEESVKRPDSSLKPFWDMAELQVQVLGHETAGLSKVRNISWRHFLSATPMYQKRGSSKRKKSRGRSRSGMMWVYHQGMLKLQHPSNDLHGGMEQPWARSYGATTAGKEAAARLALVLLIVFAKKSHSYFWPDTRSHVDSILEEAERPELVPSDMHGYDFLITRYRGLGGVPTAKPSQKWHYTRL